MNTLAKLDKYLKDNRGEVLPEIRYFSGLDTDKLAKPYCTVNGLYKGTTIVDSLEAFLKSN